MSISTTISEAQNAAMISSAETTRNDVISLDATVRANRAGLRRCTHDGGDDFSDEIGFIALAPLRVYETRWSATEWL